MKKIFLLATFLAVSFVNTAQVAIGTSTADAAAALEIQSTTKGFLPPRMSLAQIKAITSVSKGLMVYCTDCISKGLYVYVRSSFLMATYGSALGTAESDAILVQIGTAADDPDTVNSVVTAAQLADILPALTAITTEYLTNYQDDIDANPNKYSSPALQTEVQTMITGVNASVAILEQIGTEAGTGTSTVTFSQLGDLYPALTDVGSSCISSYQEYIGANGGLFSSTATQAEVQSMISAVNTVWYADEDGDGYGDPNSSETACSSTLTNATQDNTDCNDADASINPTTIWYADADGDGYGDAASNETGCTSTLTNATQDNTDCDDTDDTLTDTNCTTDATTNVTSASGRVWMDRNLGALQVATSATDADSYGDLYQWGRGTDGHQLRDSGTTNTTSSTDTPGHSDFIKTNRNWRSSLNDNLWQGVSGTNNPCPTDYRLPTSAEWETEMSDESITAGESAYASALKLPKPGYRNYGEANLNYLGVRGYYWSSTVSGEVVNYLFFTSDSTSAEINTTSRGNGFSVRCIKEE